ncbi:hypothetical protein [Encephalitozoon cuniculi GB-M1]|uniref:CAP-Gly domain-containing protein n=1 Tax=Encephalitozoon cuniculi (strain GB-M1) TaxID=284813 RepID=Q8SVD8_ENCCU|nr:uncharacterized protein ECU06_0410 [Encephalitozoon cuniculi GB-M1]CAD25401.1 hypothetical protein [Encephalitozoon cuniculi GB-M1]
MSLLTVNDRLTLGDKFKGTVRYIGKIKSKDGKWIGLELDDPVGANDGSVNGVKYFHCKDRHGIFIRYEKIRGGLVCESKGMDGDGEVPQDRIHFYESKIRRLEETIEALKSTEKEEIVELRRENEEIKKIILSLRERIGSEEPERNGSLYSELKEFVKNSRRQVYDMVELVSDISEILNRNRSIQRSSVRECERHRVMFLVNGIIDGVLDENAGVVERLRREFVSIMKSHGINVE